MRGNPKRTLVVSAFFFSLLILVFSVCDLGCGSGTSPSTSQTTPTATATASATVSYMSDIQPIWVAHCVSCHAQGGQAGSIMILTENLSYAQLTGGASPRVVPNDASGSLLIKRVEETIPPRMPTVGASLTPPDIQKIRDWISQGARNN